MNKQQSNPKQCDHPTLNLDTQCNASTLKKTLLQFFNYPLKHCAHCGALIPELKIRHNEQTYAFCCYTVAEYEKDENLSKLGTTVKSDTKVVLETDYPKFRDYLKKRFPLET